MAYGGVIRGWLRSGGALILLAFVICHFVNHSLLLISFNVAMAGHRVLIEPWRTDTGTVLLSAGGIAHYGNALWSIYARRALRLSRWGWWQLCLGFSIPLMLAVHLADNRLGELVTGQPGNYAIVLLRMWVLTPWLGILQRSP